MVAIAVISTFPEYGCRAVGQQSGIITTLLRCILQVPQYIAIEQRFDLLVLVSICSVCALLIFTRSSIVNKGVAQKSLPQPLPIF